jgi:2',3'-cyclic-nucleotide 2'-phosphodiesterase (5'-nucleotidase family)
VTTVTVFYMVDLDGAFASFDCRAVDELRAGTALDYANSVAALDRARAEARARGEPEPLLLLGGDVLAPGPFARDLLATPGGPGALFALLGRAGVDHMAFGNHEFDVDPPRLGEFLGAAEAHGLRADIANVDCDPAASGVCRYLGDDGGRLPRHYRLFERGGVRIAVVSVLDETLPRHTAPGHAAGLTFRNAARTARDVIHGLRSRGEADVIVLIAHLERSSTAPRAVLDLARSLEGDEQPDLILSNGLHGEAGTGAGAVEVIRLSEGLSPIVGTERFAVHPGFARLRVERPAPAPLAAPAPAATAAPAPLAVPARAATATAAPAAAAAPARRARVTLEAVGEIGDDPTVYDTALRARFVADTERYCAAAAAPVGPGRMAAPMDADAFTAWVLEVMRRTTGGEIALLNAGAVGLAAAFPFRDHLSSDDLLRALPFDSKLVVARVKGDELERFLQLRWKLTRIPGKHALRVAGAETRDGETFTVNGRPLESDVPYRVVTIDFVAAGGDDILEGFSGEKWAWSPWRRAGAAVVLRDAVAAYLRDDLPPVPRRAAGGAGAAPLIGLAADFHPLADRFLFDLRLNLNAGLSNVTVRSTLSPGETALAANLVRDQLASLVSDLALSFSANSSAHAFDWLLRYAFAVSSPDLLAAPFVVNTDVLTLDSVYKLSLFKRALGPDRAWVPEPYLGTFLETELIPPRDAAGRPIVPPAREAVFTAGWRFTLGRRLEAKLGAGLESIGLGPRVDPPAFVVEAGFRLQRAKLSAPGALLVFLTADATAYVGERQEMPYTFGAGELRARATLEVALGWRVFLTVSQAVYALAVWDERDAALRAALAGDGGAGGSGDPGPRLRLGLATDTLAAIKIDLDFRALRF